MSAHIEFALKFALFALVHSLGALAWTKERVRCSPRVYRLCYNLASLALFGWVMVSGHHSRVLYVAPGSWSLILYLAQICIILMLTGCLRQTGVKEFLGLTDSGPLKLATTGWYAVVRHPLYLLSMLFFVTTPVMTVCWALLTGLSGLYFVIGGLIEERRLIDEFGEEYLAYRKSVPFIIPFPGSRGVKGGPAEEQ